MSFKKLMGIEKKLGKLSSVSSIAHYDMATSMPKAGAAYRGDLSELLSIEMAKISKSKGYNKLVESLLTDESLTEDQKLIVKRIHKDLQFSNRVPVQMYGKLAKAAAECNTAWEEVKKHDKDDSDYLKALDKQIGLIKKFIDYANKGEFATPYDYLLDGYSEGFDSATIAKLFNDLEPFIKAQQARIGDTESEIFFEKDETELMKFCQMVAEKIIGNPDSFHLAKSTHPFCTTLGKDDVRITTRIKPGMALDCVGSVVHESGHATYELGLDSDHYFDIFGSAASIAAHEGISLFYEKHIGESLPFASLIDESLDFNMDHVQEYFLGINSKNLIRTESDELTYQLHIIRRTIVEMGIFNKGIKTKDIPHLWNALYDETLKPSVGYAVDVHWSQGSFGYFPSYTIGHLIAAQLKNKMSQEIQMFDGDEIKFDSIREWLSRNYFVHGARYNTPELVKVATGTELSSTFWKDYIMSKWSA